MTIAFHNPTQYRPAHKAPAACVRACECLGMFDGLAAFGDLLRRSSNKTDTHVD